MRARTLMSLCGGLLLAMTSIGAHSGVSSSTAIVNRTLKHDRLPLPQSKALRAPIYKSQLPKGCEALISSSLHSELAQMAGRCVS
jgi:hypothetical protein